MFLNIKSIWVSKYQKCLEVTKKYKKIAKENEYV